MVSSRNHLDDTYLFASVTESKTMQSELMKFSKDSYINGTLKVDLEN